MPWDVIWMPRALRELERLPESERIRVVAKVRASAVEPARFFQRLRASPMSRLRVGDQRVLAILAPRTKSIEIHSVRHRSTVYDR